MKRIYIAFFLAGMVCCHNLIAQLLADSKTNFTRADSLRGTLNNNRIWWDVLYYNLNINPNIKEETIEGVNQITFKVVCADNPVMQIDLQQPLVVDSIIHNTILGHEKISFIRDENIVLFTFKNSFVVNAIDSICIYYHGKPRRALKAPWDGGIVWTNDDKGNPWIATACQGLGASVWYPCKDHQSDEPNDGMTIAITVPNNLSAVSNGRNIAIKKITDSTTSWVWQVKAPINNYDIALNIGQYQHFGDTLIGIDGKLDLDFWALSNHYEKAKRQFKQCKNMLHAFEYWFGKYPFYEDGYKLIETPYLGMEHQSGVAYGNGFANGYLGHDLSGTGWGLKWDFIIVHESGHEWFGNNITTKDIADMWVHEGFTCYSETLYTEWLFGKEAGNEYNFGLRKNILNEIPIIGPYGVNKEGSGDMYYKGSNMLQTIRHAINNDTLFRNILHDINKEFYHKTVTTQEVESYFCQKATIPLKNIFDQYLRTTQIPNLEYYIKNKQLYYRWSNCVDSFNLPIVLCRTITLHPTTQWQLCKESNIITTFIPENIEHFFYVGVKEYTATK